MFAGIREGALAVYALLYMYNTYFTTRRGRHIGYDHYVDKNKNIRQTFFGVSIKMEENTKKLIENCGEDCYKCGSSLRFLHMVENDIDSLVGLHPSVSSTAVCKADCGFQGDINGEKVSKTV